MECYTDCNKAFFPEIQCTRSSIQFRYAGNRYNKFYEFKRPDIRLGETGVDNYEKCKGFISENAQYDFISHLKRQPRIHTCFSYCINGDDANVIGETRSNCVDLQPSERDKMLCLYPEETCEKTTVGS
jgi:hypothetical protein